MYSPPDIIRNLESRRLSWAVHVACLELSRNAYIILVGKPEGNRPLGRPRLRWEDNIEMDLKQMGCDEEWIDLCQDRGQYRAYLRTIMNLQDP